MARRCGFDSDTFFLKPTTFVENNKCLYNYGTEYHKPYFDHMEKLDKDLTKIDKSKSGICHHMIFDKKYLCYATSYIRLYYFQMYLKQFVYYHFLFLQNQYHPNYLHP